MKCPVCGADNDWSQDQCLMCGRDIAYVRDRVFLGHQFAFFEASEGEPIRVELTPVGGSEPEEWQFTQPTIVSRHEHGIRLGQPPPYRGVPLPISPADPGQLRLRIPHYLPALDFPRLNLVSVCTDRQIYRPQDRVHIFVAGLDAAGQEVDLEIELDGRRVYHTRLRLDAAGLHLGHFRTREEGEYCVRVKLVERAAHAAYKFLCKEFKAVSLMATVESYSYQEGRLCLDLRLAQLGIPYHGPLELTLHVEEQVVGQGRWDARDGKLEAEFELDMRTLGVLVIEMSTPEGDTSAVTLPSMGWGEHDRVTLSSLDPPVEAALTPFGDAEGEIRALHYVHEKDEGTPFALESVVAEEGCIQARHDADLVLLLLLDPLSGGRRQLRFQGVKKGDVLRFEVGSPYSVFTLGAFLGRARLPYEAWGMVVRPVGLKASLKAPEAAAPGETILARVEADRAAFCLLVVYDERMEHEDALTWLALRIFLHVFESTWCLEAGSVAQVGWVLRAGLSAVVRSPWGAGAPMKVGLTLAYLAHALDVEELPSQISEYGFDVQAANLVPVDTRETRIQTLLRQREYYPELAHIELFPVEGTVERCIQLGHQARTWRCRAYLFRDHDYVSVSRDIQVSADV